MTDNEIIKANTLIEKLKDAYDAYYDESRGMPYDIDTTLRESSFLIKALMEENKGLIAGQETLQKYIAEQQVEIERLTEQKMSREKDGDYWMVQTRMSREKEKTAKSEAIKEFAERFEKEIETSPNMNIHFKFALLRYVRQIKDNLVKEMVGD